MMGMWKPKMNSADVTKGKDNILWEAFQKMQPSAIELKLSDEDGLFGIVTDKGVLVAKRYVYGDIVSCHQRAVFSALNQKKDLIMYIKDEDKFYKFNPITILIYSETNKRGNSIMRNFNIGFGKRFNTLHDIMENDIRLVQETV